MPHPYIELSVTRHLNATEAEIWEVGIDVAAQIERKLYGRADIQAGDCNIDSLQVTAKPILPNNPNHADIEGWPSAKQDQKAIALKLAASASQLIPPPPENANYSLADPAPTEISKSLIEPEKFNTPNSITEQIKIATKEFDARLEKQPKNTSQRLNDKDIFTIFVIATAIGGLMIAITKWILDKII